MCHEKQCPFCRSVDIEYEPTITYCKKCGLVLQGMPEYTELGPTEYLWGVKF